MAENKTTMKISDKAHNFFYDVQSNIGTIQKRKNLKRKKIYYTNALDFLIDYLKLNNDAYLEYIDLVVENGSE